MINKTLKPGWRRVKFGDVVRLSKGRSQDPLADGIERYVGLEHLEPGDLRIRSWGNVADGVTFTSMFQPGQVLFGKRRAYQRKVAVADFSGVCSGDIYVLETKDTQVLLPELLPFICQTDAFFDHAVGTSAGSLSPRTNWTSLANFEFSLPSIAEQEKLLELFESSTSSIESLRVAMQKCLAFFTGCDRTLQGYEGLIAAQQCLPNNELRDNFAAEYNVLNKIWEALSPDTVLGPFEKDYKWLSQVYQSVQPSSGHGKLIWHSLGAKTIELIHQNVHVGAVRDDLDTLVLDADLLEAVLSNPDPKKAKEIEIKLKRRLRGHGGNPKFKKLSERLDALKDRFESGQISSVEFLKQLLEIAKETLQAEKEVPPEEDEDRGKAALTELFNEVKTSETPIMVERVVADIDEIVRLVRFPGWQGTQAGEREVKKALRKALFKYKLHADEELFEKAYSYIRQYY